ncbi:ABC transporter ATP-binding protein [Apibacter sp. HY039]|uniref:ABC transporter ATP-binding protein n=1 Tax=Apibacter sp. HY039 TaxID=2501476 RepID=UPI000FEBDB07|nr:ABC transporter ATP-binding protein [Apibacter sp. HY039]
MPIIEVNSLHKIFKGNQYFTINNLNLTIKRHQVYGLLGPNGAGKTTLISILCGLLNPTSGTVLLNGLSYKKDARKIQNFIGVVPQEYALYPTLTAYENLTYFGSLFGIPSHELKFRINEGLNEVGLSEFAHKQIRTFSGGMKRRINILSGILHKPEIIFLDEPTVGVDVQSKESIMNYLKRLNKEGATIIYTSHHLNEAQNFCSQIAIIDLGKIIAQGTPKQLIESVDGAENLENVFINLTGKELRDYA